MRKGNARLAHLLRSLGLAAAGFTLVEIGILAASRGLSNETAALAWILSRRMEKE